MSVKVILDKQIRYVEVEHVCTNGRSKSRAEYIEVPYGEPYLRWNSDPNASHCGYCGEALPKHPDEETP